MFVYLHSYNSTDVTLQAYCDQVDETWHMAENIEFIQGVWLIARGLTYIYQINTIHHSLVPHPMNLFTASAVSEIKCPYSCKDKSV